MSRELKAGAVPPNREVDKLQAGAKPANLTGVGKQAGEVRSAKSVASAASPGNSEAEI